MLQRCHGKALTTVPSLLARLPQVFHPNVDPAGNICLDILKDKWSAAYSVSTVLLSLQSLLGEPNNASPLNVEASQLWNSQVRRRQPAAAVAAMLPASGRDADPAPPAPPRPSPAHRAV